MYSGHVRRLQDLCKHLSEYPEARGVALQNEAIGQILSILSRSKENMATQLQANEALAELGYQKPLHGKGKKKMNSKEDKELVIIMHLQGKNYDFVSINWIAEITRALSFKQER